MISYIYVLNTHGEPYSTGSLVECTGYTGRHWMGLLLLVLVYYSLGVGVQLPVGKYISYSRGYLVVSIWCKVGYLVGAVPVAVCLYAPVSPLYVNKNKHYSIQVYM